MASVVVLGLGSRRGEGGYLSASLFRCCSSPKLRARSQPLLNSPLYTQRRSLSLAPLWQ